jgi:hypothetical protein
MKTLLAKWLIVALAAALLPLVVPLKTAYACTMVAPFKPITAADRTLTADVVLEGTVISTTNPIATTPAGLIGYPTFHTTAIIDVHDYLKGSGPSRITVDGFGQGTDCRAPISVGVRAIFYVASNPATNPPFHYRHIGRDDRWTIAEIKVAAANPAVGNLISYLTAFRDSGWRFKVGSTVIFAVGLSFIWWRAARKKRIRQRPNELFIPPYNS